MSKKTILIVEDEENLVELLKFRLESNGYNVDFALDGKAGLEKIRILKPDLVILDIMIPKMHGYEVLRLAKASGETKEIPILVLTARSQQRDRSKALMSGADAYIAKPFEPAELLDEVKKLVTLRE